MKRNLASPRARWRASDPMAEHDRLPPDLRAWLIHAALPWSASSARRLWQRAIAEGGGPDQARALLESAERKTLRREAAAIWGKDYPQHPQADA